MTENDQTPPAYQPPPEYQAPPQQEYQAPPPPVYQAPPPQYGQPVYGAEKPTHTPSLVLGIIAIIGLWFTAGILGIVCGIIGMVMAQKAKYTHKTTVGFVLSIIALIIGVLALIGTVIMGAAFGSAMGLF